MNSLVEELVRVVVRAFYSDECIVVMEGLLREKFLKDDEMGNAVHLQTRQVRKVLAELYLDHMVCKQSLNDKSLGGSSSMVYWYIDYKHFVDVVKFRLYKMSEFLKEAEQHEMVQQIYNCSNEACGKVYTALEVQRLITPGVFEFRCGHCSEELLEANTNETLHTIQELQKKFKEQMNRQDGLHAGITELLRKIGQLVASGQPLETNLPSENRAAGIGGESTSISMARGGGGGGGGNRRGNGVKENAQSYLYTGSSKEHIQVNIEGEENEEDYGRKRKRTMDRNGLSSVKKIKSQPAFLEGSIFAKYLKKQKGEEDVLDKLKMDDHEQISLENKNSEELRQAAFRDAFSTEIARCAKKLQLKRKELLLEKVSTEEDTIEWQNCQEERTTPSNTKIGDITDDDLATMSQEEYLDCFKHAASVY